jgi:enolase
MNTNKIKGSYKSVLLACAAFALLLGTACEKETNDDISAELVGSWHQTAHTIDGAAAAKDSTRMALKINATNICLICDSTATAVKANAIIKRSGWSYSGERFNIAIDIPASWSVTPGSNKMSLKRVDFNPNGTLKETVLEYVRIADLDIE